MFETVESISTRPLSRLCAGAAFMVAVVGCSNQTGLFSNSDPQLRKTDTQFAADAAKRHYETDAPGATPPDARALVDYQTKTIALDNLSSDDWTGIEVWIDHKYVLFIPTLQMKTAKSLSFDMFFDQDGNFFTQYGQGALTMTIDIYRDGKMFTNVPYSLPDH